MISFTHSLHFFIELAIIFWFYSYKPKRRTPSGLQFATGVVFVCIPFILYNDALIVPNVWLRLLLRVSCYTVAFVLLRGFTVRYSFLCSLVCMSVFSANSSIWITPFLYRISRDLVVFVDNPYMNSILTSAIKYSCCTFLFWVVLKTVNLQSVPDDDYHIYVILALILMSEQYTKDSMNAMYINNQEPSKELSIYAIILQLFLILLLIVYVRYTDSLRRNKLSMLQQVSSNYQLDTLRLRLKNDEELRTLRHDMKNHMLLLEHYLVDEKNPDAAQAYIESLLSEIDRTKSTVETGLALLDGLFAQKTDSAHAKGIETSVDFDGRSLSMMEDIDICALFGNLWDNAIEASIKVEPPGNRKISIQGRRNKNQYFISMTNRYSGKLSFMEGLPVTSKRNKDNHGYGLRNVRRIVEKYHGVLTLDTEDNLFTICIMFPLSDN